MAKPPAGLDDVFVATMVLLAGVSPAVVTTKAGKVKDRSWDAAKKQLLGEKAGSLSKKHIHINLHPFPSYITMALIFVSMILLQVISEDTSNC